MCLHALAVAQTHAPKCLCRPWSKPGWSMRGAPVPGTRHSLITTSQPAASPWVDKHFRESIELHSSKNYYEYFLCCAV